MAESASPPMGYPSKYRTGSKERGHLSRRATLNPADEQRMLAAVGTFRSPGRLCFSLRWRSDLLARQRYWQLDEAYAAWAMSWGATWSEVNSRPCLLPRAADA